MNYKGEDTFKTTPGGCLSIVYFLWLLAYFFVKLKYMLAKVDWQITQQVIVAGAEDFEQVYNFSDYSNITLALQIETKRPAMTHEQYLNWKVNGTIGDAYSSTLEEDDRIYQNETEFLARYLSFKGIAEIKKGNRFEVFNNFTESSFDWKVYDNPPRRNSHNFNEIPIQISDMVLFGSAAQGGDYVIPRF